MSNILETWGERNAWIEVQHIFNDKKVADGKLNLILINQKFKAFKTNQFDQNNIRKAFK